MWQEVSVTDHYKESGFCSSGNGTPLRVFNRNVAKSATNVRCLKASFKWQYFFFVSYRIEQRAAIWPKDETQQDFHEVGALTVVFMNVN